MAQPVLDIDRPEREQSRTELTLGRIAREWGYQPRGKLFTTALLDFLRSAGSSDTLRSYSFSILQFFDWYARERGRLPTPDLVRRADAIQFNRWLLTRERGLTRWRLDHDPSRRLDQHIFEVVSRNPGIDIARIQAQLGMWRPNAKETLAQRLACLAKIRTLMRTPTVAEYRAEHGGGILDPPDDVFRYFVPAVQAPEGPERASTVATRLSALSSLWMFMIRSGENVPGAMEPLLQHNIWRDLLKQAQAQAPSHRAATRARKTPDMGYFLRLLATTFHRTHGRGGAPSLMAAQAAFQGRAVERRGGRPSFADVRDRALLLFMSQTGARSKEIGALRRGEVQGDPPMVTLLGKRGKKRTVLVPPPALAALRELSAKLGEMATHQERYRRENRAALLLTSAAPLFPAVAYWGANAGMPERGLSRPAISYMLKRRAAMAGMTSAALMARAHPHGLRHLFIKYALDTGTPIHRVQAIAGHASVATTGRYAEERAPEMLVAEVFRGAPAPPALPAAPVRPRAPEAVLEEEIEPIAPPAAPRPEPPEEREPIEPREVRRFEPEPFEEEPPAPPPPPPVPPKKPAVAFDKFVQQIARWRRKPITAGEASTLRKCEPIVDESLRNLCVTYDIFWGEKGNRQVLVSTGGGKASAATRARREVEQAYKAFEPNQPEEWEEEFEFEPTEEELAEMEEEEEDVAAQMEALAKRGMQPITRAARARGAALHAEIGTDKTYQIYSGKDSGLSWWTGTNRKLKPDMPVMSPSQVGACAPEEQDEICAGVVKLWRQWMSESPTKAESLVQWVADALDVAAQMEQAVRERGGKWLPSIAPWAETKYEGSRREPAPRMAFREHLPQEVVAWFKARGGQYRVSPGDPATWRAKTRRPKPLGEMAPDWYADEDPILALPRAERAELLDWMLALTGQLPVDAEPRFGTEQGWLASRAEIARWIEALCRIDQSIDALREDVAFGPRYTAGLLSRKSVEDFPTAVRRGFVEAQAQARQAMSAATAARVTDYDAYDAIRKRIKRAEAKEKRETKQRVPGLARIEAPAPPRGRITELPELEAEAEAEAQAEVLRKKQFLPNAARRDTWYMRLVRKYFGPAAATDPALKLVAKCGRVPLLNFQQLFRVQGGTVRHTPEFKRAFAEEFGVHSECVARRIARRLWEIKSGRAAPKEAVTRPQHMVTLVEVMRTFKVPCTELQEMELEQLRGWPSEPTGMYAEWAKIRTAAGAAREEISEAAEDIERIQAEAEELREAAMRMEVFGKEGFRENPRRPILPTPVHLTVAVMV